MDEDQILERVAREAAEAMGYRWELLHAMYDTRQGPSKKCLEDGQRAAIAAYKAALAEAGYKIAPDEPSSEMRDAGEKALLVAYRKSPHWEEGKDMAEDFDPVDIYRAMLAAAPDQR